MEIVQFLVDKGADLNAKNVDDATPIMMSARRAHTEIFELLINSGSEIHCCDHSGENLVHHASYGGSVEMVQCLVKKGVAFDLKNSDGETPLMIAAHWSNEEVVEYLVKLDVDIHCCDSRGRTVMHHAVMISVMLSDSDERGSAEIVQCLLNKGATFDMRSLNGETPLMMAAKKSTRCTRTAGSSNKIAKYLLEAGADCNLEDNNGVSSFNYLVKKTMSIDLIKLCIEKGAYVQSTDYDTLSKEHWLRQGILQDITLCSQAVINKFNHRDLPLFYKRFASVQKLPPIDKMKIRKGSGMALQVEQSVAQEVQANGFCNLYEMVPLVLSISCVKTLIENYEPVFNQANLSESKNGLKRLGFYAH